MATKEAIKQRRRQIYDLMLMGETQENIARKFDITPKQVFRDLQNIRKELAKDYDKQDTLQKFKEYDERSLQRRRRLWLIVADKESTKSDINQALRELRSEDEFSVKMDQRLGLIPKEVSPLISIQSESKEGDAENKVQINIIAPKEEKKEVKKEE
jgi:uncharacterized protein with HEPN domain